ncbi:pyridoxal phosphate-dependent transferase [Fusarium venenatum]|uniref:pyridoxal phosphate-dependent transferase n=1 Tax=Fusarium venenatum TaxID=56646 RepID=UPI001DD54F7F|nr:pyridoxal phosphate-dependent transferase [Fusarium venenatum]
MKAELGSSLPPGDKHARLKAVSVYIPTWKDTLAWARRDPELISQLKTGYPRFFVPLVVGQLSEKLLQWPSCESTPDKLPSELRALLAAPGRSAMLLPAGHYANMCQKYLNAQNKGAVFALQADFNKGVYLAETLYKKCSPDEIYAVVYPRELAAEAKAFWQHTGFGVSSRRATHWLESAPFLNRDNKSPTCRLQSDEAADAKVRVQKRIARLFSTETNNLDADDIFLYPSGMSSISHTADTIVHMKTDKKRTVAIFGFLYVDTFKVLSKIYGFDCKLYGATPSDLDALEADLAGELQLSALFTEFPGNPLLGSVDLERLKKLAIDYEFLFVVDDTVATSVNVELISYCDVVCTSLTKMFSGSCNVMGGSIALNPQSRLFSVMKRLLKDGFVDTYFSPDAIVMEKNSADFQERVITASENAERTAAMLRNHESVEQVYYPKGNPTQDIYEKYKRPERGYGYLLSIRFRTPEAAIAFHDALNVAKGPSLGTNFTLCCAYTLFAHFSELDWAAKYGVVEHLVRVSVGIESQETLDELVRTALSAASQAKQEYGYIGGKL